jgi:cytochrome P450
METARKVDRGATDVGCPVERGADGVWRVRGHAAGRAVLRSTDTVQAGLGVETVENLPPKIRRPVLYRDGEEHREYRRQTARFFTPRRVDEHCRGLMIEAAERRLDILRRDGEADLSALRFRLAIDRT